VRRGIACTAFVAALGWAGTASAATLCVPNINILACHGVGANELTISDAITNANDGDTIFVGAGTYNESPQDTSKKLSFIGAGMGTTVIQGQGSPAMAVASGSTVSNLTIDLYNAPGETGLQLVGVATGVAVTATQPMSATNPIGVQLEGGSFTRGSVTLPLTGSEVDNYAGVIGSGTLTDSSVTAPVGIADAGGTTPGIPTVHRVRILANQGVLVGTQGFTIDDSIVRTHAGAKPELGIGLSDLDESGTFTLRHVDVIGSGGAGSTGIHAYSDGFTLPGVSSALLESSIVHGYATSVEAIANGMVNSAHTTVTLRHTLYDSAHTSIQQLNGGAVTIAPDSHSGNLDPLFVNPVAGDFHLKAGSPAIDAGESTLGAGESSTDLDGHARLISGHNGDAAISDIGAYEFVPRVPTAHASASATRVAGGSKIRFSATGADPAPGDLVAFAWHFDDGSSASGATVTHAFVKAGRHTATVTATDLDRFSASASLKITVLGPSISKLKFKPGRLHRGHKATISYRDSQAATTTFKLYRVGSRQALRTLTHRDHAGSNSLHFKAKKLARGRYRLQAVPRNKAGAGRAVSVKFRVVG
jgi:hypothetical protein